MILEEFVNNPQYKGKEVEDIAMWEVVEVLHSRPDLQRDGVAQLLPLKSAGLGPLNRIQGTDLLQTFGFVLQFGHISLRVSVGQQSKGSAITRLDI